MKKIIALILCAVILVALAACGSLPSSISSLTSQPTPSPTAAPSESTEPLADDPTPVHDENVKMWINLDIPSALDEITATAWMIAKAEDHEFTFYMGQSFTIDEVSNENGILEWDDGYTIDGYYITVPAETGDIISVKYHGGNWDYRSFLKPETVALIGPAGWHPRKFLFPDDVSDQIRIKVTGLSDYTVVNGEYDGRDGTWTYYSVKSPSFENYSATLIAFREGTYFTTPDKTVYCLDEADVEKAVEIHDYIVDVLKYYNGILYSDYKKEQQNEKVTVISYSTGEGGMYYEDGLMILHSIFANINEDDGTKEGMAHEFGHLWANGAAFNWEDWLNETCANWSARLYLLHSGQQDVFERIIAGDIEKSAGQPPIKTADGRHPGDTHAKGAVLFYEIYQEYCGAETIAKLLNIFVSLEEKNTDNFIAEVRVQVGDEVADYIQAGLLV